MKQKTISILLTILMSMVGTKAFAHDIEVMNDDGVTIYYNYFNEGKELEVAGATDYGDSLVIPEKVTFMNRERKVTSIGSYALAWKYFKKVVLPPSIVYIQERAFSGSQLSSINLPDNLKSIGAYAFEQCHIQSINIPNSTNIIDEYAFANNPSLTMVSIGSGITHIKSCAFDYTPNIDKVIIRDISAWCDITFDYLTSNPLYYSGHIYSDENNEITNLNIPDGVTSIKDYAFSYCGSLVSVTLPQSITSLGNFAFSNCKALTSITIPKNVSSFGEDVFREVDFTTVVSLIENPMEIAGKNDYHNYGTLYNYAVFSLNTVNNATLYVPIGTINKYKTTKGWEDFMFIKEGTPTDIHNIKGDETNEIQRYTLDGRLIKNSHKGINIIKMKNGTTKKVLVK